MKTIMVFIFSLALLFIGSHLAFAQDVQPQSLPAGQKIFLEAKCNQCHSLEVLQVEKESGGYTKIAEKNVPPDLSKVGAKRDAAWITKYLKKKETNNGFPHSKTFRRSDADLKTLADWLATLK